MWTHVYEYYRQAGHAYALVVDAVLQGAKGADPAKPLLSLLVVRALRALSQQIKWLHLRYGPIEPRQWRVLSGVYAFAESRGLVDEVGALYAGLAESTPRREFMGAMMLGLSSPDSLLPAEVDLAERAIAELGGNFAIEKEGGAGLSHWTDLAEPMAPLRLARLPQPTPGLRFLGPGSALAALEAMMRRIEATGQLPPALAGATIGDTETVIEVLQHLHLYWSPAPPERKHPRHAVKSRLSIVHGFAGVMGALNGSGASLDFDKQAAENWIVENVSAGGFGAVVPQAKGDWLKIGTLLAMQPDGGNNWVVGMVRRVSKVSNKEARVGIQTLSRAPELAHFALRGNTEQGVLLPAAGLGTGEASIALPTGAFVPGQNLENQRGGRSYVYMPQDVAEHGDDYDIVRFREMIRDS